MTQIRSKLLASVAGLVAIGFAAAPASADPTQFLKVFATPLLVLVTSHWPVRTRSAAESEAAAIAGVISTNRILRTIARRVNEGREIERNIGRSLSCRRPAAGFPFLRWVRRRVWPAQRTTLPRRRSR